MSWRPNYFFCCTYRFKGGIDIFHLPWRPPIHLDSIVFGLRINLISFHPQAIEYSGWIWWQQYHHFLYRSWYASSGYWLGRGCLPWTPLTRGIGRWVLKRSRGAFSNNFPWKCLRAFNVQSGKSLAKRVSECKEIQSWAFWEHFRDHVAHMAFLDAPWTARYSECISPVTSAGTRIVFYLGRKSIECRIWTSE